MKRVLAKKVSGAARSWSRPIFHCQPRSRRAPELLLLVEENDGRPEIGRMRACVSIVLLAVPLSPSLSLLAEQSRRFQVLPPALARACHLLPRQAGWLLTRLNETYISTPLAVTFCSSTSTLQQSADDTVLERNPLFTSSSSTSYKPHSFPSDRVHPSTSSLDWQLSMDKTSSPPPPHPLHP